MIWQDETSPIRVMLVADQPVFISLLEASLARQPDLEVVARAGSLTGAREHAETVVFDVAVLDLGLPDGNGADLISDLRGSNPDASVLIVSGSLDPASFETATEGGADEIMDKFAPLRGRPRHGKAPRERVSASEMLARRKESRYSPLCSISLKY